MSQLRPALRPAQHAWEGSPIGRDLGTGGGGGGGGGGSWNQEKDEKWGSALWLTLLCENCSMPQYSCQNSYT